MRPLRLAAVVTLVVLLAASVAAGNAAVAAERTVLSGPFVKATLAEEDAYGNIRSVMAEPTAGQVGGGGEPEAADGSADAGGLSGLPVSQSALVEAAVSEAYVRRQVERNVDAVYGYLHGDRDRASVHLDLTPLPERVGDGVESKLRNASFGELLAPVASDDGTLSLGGVAVDAAVFDDLAESPAAYREAREEFREQVRGAVLDEAVEEAYGSASNDELLALVIEGYDPDDHTEAEKDAMVADREAEIRAALRREIETRRGDEIDRRVDRRLDELPEIVRARAESGGSTGDLPPELADSYTDLAVVGVEGLAGEQDYATYTDRLGVAKARFAANAGGFAEDQLAAEMPDRVVFADTADPETGTGLERARRAVGVVDLASVALPALSALLVGGLWLLTRSGAVTAAGGGVALLVGGIPGYAAASVVPSLLADGLSGGDVPPEVRELVVGVGERTAAVLAGQSLLLSAAGALLVGAAVYLRAYGPPAWALGERVRRVTDRSGDE